MTVSTLDRRSFLQKLGKPEPRHELDTKSGKGKYLLPLHEIRELPPVPPAATTVTINGGLEPYAGPWGYEQAGHLLRRTGFGLKKTDLDLLLSLTMSDAVDHLLDLPPDAPAPPVNNYNNPDYTDPAVASGDVWVNADYDVAAEGYRIESFRGWWTNLMLTQEASILEKMTLFWHNHFATKTAAVFYGKTNYQHNAKLRANALGNFKELVKTVTLDPMMLYFLNGVLNGKDAPDENYARELQELFTVGKDAPNQYTEDDVVAAARVLTGWRINPLPNETFFYPIEHDTGDKQFSAFYNNTVIQGSTNGEAELDALLDMIFAKEEVSKFICRKIYRWFIYYVIDETVEQNVIEPLALLFRNSNYEIKPVMETLLKSEHFYDAINKGCFIKTPVDVVVGTLRSFNLGIPGSTPWDDFVMKYYLSYFHGILQMLPGDPPNVAGWQAFRQSPLYYRMWINGDTARNRNYYTDILSTYFLESDNDQLKIDHVAFATQFDNPDNASALVEDVTNLLLPQPISETKKALLKTVLLSGLPNDTYWTVAWYDYANNPGDQMAFQVVNIRLTLLHKYVMNLPEYQLA
ncbi:MAG: DUF1800 domain-containing protein [Saprospiraceae bacterium]|nr:MAG: DUF1800 domain-containing protein [Saprospiraceae bacterium]